MVRKYSIWNAAIALLQFWTADLDPVTLGRATEEVYTAYFYSSSAHTLHQQSDEIYIHHVSSIEHVSFNPDPVTPQNTLQAPPRPVCRQLSFSSSDDDATPEVTSPNPRTTPANTPEYLEDEEEEDF